MSAYVYYRQEFKIFREESLWKFRSEAEVHQALEYICRVYDVRVPLLTFDPKMGGGCYRPENFIYARGPSITLGADDKNLRIVSHEIAHHLDIEEQYASGSISRGFLHRYYRFHKPRHRELMHDVCTLLKGRSRRRHCGPRRSRVKVRT